MNKQQLNTMAARLNLKPLTTKACELVLIDGLTAYAAEKQVYGKRACTIGKACHRLRDEFDYCEMISRQEALGARGVK